MPGTNEKSFRDLINDLVRTISAPDAPVKYDSKDLAETILTACRNSLSELAKKPEPESELNLSALLLRYRNLDLIPKISKIIAQKFGKRIEDDADADSLSSFKEVAKSAAALIRCLWCMQF